MADTNGKRSSSDAQLGEGSTPKKSEAFDSVALSEHLASKFNDQRTSDCVVKVTDGVETETFYLHRVILERAVYFERMLSGDLKEARECHIELKETSPRTMKVLLEWLYSETLNTDGIDVRG